MIIEFSVQNFRSIYDKVTLSMMAAKLTGKEATLDNIFYHPNYPNIPLLKSAVIYGANASGKSNILKAMEFFTKLIYKSTDYKFEQKLPYEPFRLLKGSANEPTCFEIDFIGLDGVRYIYGYKMNEDEILEEYLSAFTSRKETKLFVRKKGEKIQFSTAFKGEKKVLEDQLLKNNLLLSKAANSNYTQLQKVWSYFAENLKSNFNNKLLSFLGKDYHSKRRAFEDNQFKIRITDLLKIADTGIKSLEIKRKENEYSTFSFSLSDNKNSRTEKHTTFSYEVEVEHTVNNKVISWAIDEESEGTIKLFEIGGRVLDILDKGEILFFDEINNSLHPHLSKFIIDLFHNKKTNPKNAQLIFTTHDATLLTKENFRRDQVWFTEKNSKGMTELYSLSSFDKKEVRWDVPFDRWYLTGRFGAIPNLGQLNLTPE